MRKGPIVSALLVGSVLLAACGGGTSSVSSKKTTKPASSTKAAATVQTASSSLGTILVAANGRTLYELDSDTATMSSCTAACAMLWPPLTVTGTPVAGAGVNQSLLTVLRDANGTQVVYNGHPLYEFAQDTAAGDVKGQGFAGNIWHVLTAAGQPVLTAASSATTTAPTPPPTAPPTAPATVPATMPSGSGSGSSGGYGY